MKIALIGASGNVGSKILAEAAQRGHSITAIARNPERIADLSGVTAVAGDATDPSALAELLKGHDVIVSALHFSAVGAEPLLAAVRDSGVKRYLVVGGAGSLKGPDGIEILDGPDFPDAWKPEASAGREFLRTLQGVYDLDWTYVSPSAMIAPGERTGHFRIGGDLLLIAPDGQSRISEEDFAVAFVDEIENPRHVRARFTVGY